MHDREAAAREHQDQSPSAEVAGEPELPSTAVGAGDTAAASATPPARVAPAASAPAPVPLRAPAPHPDNGPRPTSAPLWTASLTPRPSEDEAPAAHDETVAEVRAPEVVDAGASVDEPNAPRGDTARPEGEQGGASRGTTEGDAAGDEPDRSAEGPAESSSPEDETAARIDRVESAPTPDDEGVPDLEPASASASASEPAPAAVEPPGGTAAGPSSPVRLRVPAPDSTVGDTAPVVPVPRAVPGVSPAVAPVSDDGPVPLVEPGQQKVVEHCTHCGALLDEDDIFCPECGAVVQSVALSFTGPVAPLPPGWRPGATAPAPAPAAAPESEPESAPAPTPERVVDERASWARPVDEQSVEPPAAAPVEPVRRGAVPGRPADTTGRDDSAGLPELPPMPAAPATSALSGLLDDTRSRLVSDDDVDETRLVRRGPVGTEYLLQFSTGESVTVDGSGLLGRAPSPQPGERFDHLVRIADPGKSVSKTHLEFGQELGALWVSDRWSGNGTVVRPHEQPARRVEPGTRVRVARGTRVEIGEQFFIVS
nr:uncharacterized Zn finger protein (UPF0148 family) [Frigoribacterium sp. PvP032]